MKKIVCISDTHCSLHQIEVPDGDILIHAGDATFRGTTQELEEFNYYMGKLPHKHKIFIAGNHDIGLEDNAKECEAILTNMTYLKDSEVTVEGIRIYGSPYTPTFFDWAFMKDRGQDIKAVWNKIPDGIDILVTHGPPYGKMDMVKKQGPVGCKDLLEAVERIKPKYHIFGHIHCDRGILQSKDTTFINAACLNDFYNPVYTPIEFFFV